MMKTFLLLWNPNKWEWTSLESDIRDITLTGRSSHRWSCGVTKSIRPGDRVFLLRTGKDPKGIMGAGYAFTEPFYDQHWSGGDRETLFIEVDFEDLFDGEKQPILDIGILESEILDQNWHPQASGTSVKEVLCEKLESIWFDFLNRNTFRNNLSLNNLENRQELYMEGNPIEVKETRYERNPHARRRCIDHFGYSCIVWGFNFEAKYGELGKEYIHVHHLEQIAQIGESYPIDPIKDLRPICPNCHAMIHRNKKALTIQEAKNLLQ